jgi:hypothetical protein
LYHVSKAAGYPISPDPRKTLNRHDAKAAMDGMFGTFQSRTREPVLEAFSLSSPIRPSGLGVLGALAVNNFGLGLAVSVECLALCHAFTGDGKGS